MAALLAAGCGDNLELPVFDGAVDGAVADAADSGPICVDGGDGGGDFLSDPANCGRCGNACGGGQVCLGGTCQDSCPMGTTFCGGRCFDLTNDPAHCGSCISGCGATQVCSSSNCGCPTGTMDCDGRCVNVQNDPANCGMCRMTCGAATPQCSGAAVAWAVRRVRTIAAAPAAIP